MTFEIFSSLKSLIIRWPRHLLMAGGLCLLVACGGGGGGSTGAANAPTTDPVVTFARNDSLTTVYATNTISLLPHFSYGTGKITWRDSSNVLHSPDVTSDTPLTDSPTQTTVYTLTVSYPDPANIRNTKTDVKLISVAVTALDGSYPNCTLTASNRTPQINSSVQLTSTCGAWANGVITSRSVVSSLQTSSITDGIPIVMQTPSVTGTFNYTQSVTYTDTRIGQTITRAYDATPVTVTNDLTQVTPAGSMTSARGDFTATLLSSNNLVLVAGGTSNGTAVVATANLYDPGSNTWRSTGAMTTARRGHTATLLPNGKVLVIGGTDGAAALKSAEIYDPVTELWTAVTGSMRFTRRWHTATLLTDNTVLVVGGVTGSETLNGVTTDGSTITEIYNGGAFTSVASQLPTAIQGHTATLLRNGSVLVAGRNNADGLFGADTTVIYDFAKLINTTTATWYAGPPMNNGRYKHAATRLADGRVMVSGGFASGNASTEIFTPAASPTSGSTYGSWTPGPTMLNTRTQHTTTLLRSGAVMAIGGYNGTSAMTSIEVLSSPTSAWTALPHNLTTARAMHNSTLLSNVSTDPITHVSIDKVLVTGTYLETFNSSAPATTELVWSP